jgi:hypothetical protein
MSKFYCTICCLFIFFCASAQDTEVSAQKTVKQFYTELGGPGILFSANLDSRFKPAQRLGWGFRAGLGFTLVDQETYVNQPNGPYYSYRTRSIATLPLGINYLFGKSGSANMFEVGGGVTVFSKKASVLNYNEYSEGVLIGHFDFMYRRQPVDGGFSWRIGFTPVINPDGDIFPFGAIGLGYSFK